MLGQSSWKHFETNGQVILTKPWAKSLKSVGFPTEQVETSRNPEFCWQKSLTSERLSEFFQEDPGWVGNIFLRTLPTSSFVGVLLMMILT